MIIFPKHAESKDQEEGVALIFINFFPRIEETSELLKCTENSAETNNTGPSLIL